MKALRQVAVFLVKGYQYLISPWLGTRCRFEPSCSHYAIEALQTYGMLRGGAMACRRLMRCHPWHPGGFDPVEKPAAGACCSTHH